MKKLFTVLTGVAIAAITTAQASVSPQTLDNLNSAFQGESNAAHRYEAFAQQADAAGHAYVAKLFRAASKAESIHRETHKIAILELGGKIKDFKLDAVQAGTTAENLQAAIKGESDERDTMYPQYIRQVDLYKILTLKLPVLIRAGCPTCGIVTSVAGAILPGGLTL